MTETPITSAPTEAEMAITDCDENGCEECDVCRYLNFLEWVRSVGKPDGGTIERDERIEEHLRGKGIVL